MRSAVIAQPGNAFIYGPAALQVFHRVLKVKLAGKSPTEYLEQRVLKRLGLDPQRLSATGLAEFHPRVPNTSPDSRASNRRIDLVILNSATNAAEEPKSAVNSR